MGDIYIYNGCGCGCGGKGGSGGMLPGGAGDGGGSDLLVEDPPPGTVASGASACDVVTTIVPYVIQQSYEYLVNIQNALDSGENPVDATAEATDIIIPGDFMSDAVDILTDLAAESYNGAIAAFDDSDFVLQAQEIWWDVHRDKSRWNAITRSDLRKWARRLPITWSIPLSGNFTSPRFVMGILVELMNVSKISRRLIVAKGTGESGLCEYLASTIGETYTPPVAELLPPGYDAGFSADGAEYGISILADTDLNSDPTAEYELPAGTVAFYVENYEEPDGGTGYEIQNNGTTWNIGLNTSAMWTSFDESQTWRFEFNNAYPHNGLETVQQGSDDATPLVAPGTATVVKTFKQMLYRAVIVVQL